MFYEGIYRACSLKEVKIQDTTDRNEKYCHRTAADAIQQKEQYMVPMLYSSKRGLRKTALFLHSLFTSPKKKTHSIAIIVI